MEQKIFDLNALLIFLSNYQNYSMISEFTLTHNVIVKQNTSKQYNPQNVVSKQQKIVSKKQLNTCQKQYTAFLLKL